jgi:hypothetical protein
VGSNAASSAQKLLGNEIGAWQGRRYEASESWVAGIIMNEGLLRVAFRDSGSPLYSTPHDRPWGIVPLFISIDHPANE